MNAGYKVVSYCENLQELCPFRVSQNQIGKLLAVHMAFSVWDLGLPGVGGEQLNQRSPLGDAFVSWSGGHKFTIKVWCTLPACAYSGLSPWVWKHSLYDVLTVASILHRSTVDGIPATSKVTSKPGRATSCGPGGWDPHVYILWNSLAYSSWAKSAY